VTADPLTLELDLAPDDVTALLRQPELFEPGTRRRLSKARAGKSSLLWYDTAEGALAADCVSLARGAERGAKWRTERLVPLPGEIAAPGVPAAAIEGRDGPPEHLSALLLPVAAYEHSIRELRPAGQPPRVVLRQGEMRAVAAQTPLCRLTLSGEGAAALAMDWAGRFRLAVPVESLAATGLRLAGRPTPTRPLGAPTLDADRSVSDAFAAIVAHLSGVMLHHARLADGAHGPEPVHQMRVALRRLRSAISLFRRVVDCPAVDVAVDGLRRTGRMLGPARDWEVFALGAGAQLGAIFTDDKAVQDLLAAARRKQNAGYAALRDYLSGPEWRQLGIALAALAAERPWEAAQESDDDAAAQERREQHNMKLIDFAGRALARRYRALTEQGADLSGLDVEALHAIRLQCKRMRYACEFFAPLYPGRLTRRFLRRLSRLQERLGELNDGAVASALMDQLTSRGSARAQSIGIVKGYVAAQSGGDRRRIERCWRRLLRQNCFWQ
jgi:triphosphatase